MGDKDAGKKEPDGTTPARSEPFAYRLVVVAVFCVTLLFLVVMVFFGAIGVFSDGNQVVAALSSAFAVIGTLVGTYFGIKSTGDARDTVERVHKETAEPLRQAAERAADAAQEAAGAADAMRKTERPPPDAAQQGARTTRQSPSRSTNTGDEKDRPA